MIARENDIITCERGHPLYRITRDVPPFSQFMVSQFERLHPRATEPAPAREMRRCPMCNGAWFMLVSYGPSIMGFRATRHHFHFEDGWRPRLPGRPT